MHAVGLGARADCSGGGGPLDLGRIPSHRLRRWLSLLPLAWGLDPLGCDERGAPVGSDSSVSSACVCGSSCRFLPSSQSACFPVSRRVSADQNAGAGFLRGT